MNRNAILNALLGVLQGAVGANTSERGLRHIDDVQPEEMPYLGLVNPAQVVRDRDTLPRIVSIEVQAFIYVSRNDTGDSAGDLLNNVLDALDRVLEPMNGFLYQTLNNTPHVLHCRIVGEISIDEGFLGDKAAAVVPIEILAA